MFKISQVSSGKPQSGADSKRKNDLGSQGRLDQSVSNKQARKSFKQWSFCNKCNRRHLGDYNNAPSCYNYSKPSHLVRDCQNCYNCNKPSHFARDCSEQGKSKQKQSITRVYALAEGEAKADTSNVVVG